jgi:hypothetical protein
MTRLLAAIGICLAVLSLPALATAQPGQPPPPPPPGSSPAYGYGAYGMTVPGVHEHEGLFLRLGIGLGYLNLRTEFMDEDLDIKGPAGHLQVALGGNLSSNLILFGQLFVNAINEPTVEFNGEEAEAEDMTASLGAVGIGMAYYLPSNVYFSGTLAVSQLRLSDDSGDEDNDAETEIGPAFMAQIGKEWWVSDNWGLGLAGQFILSSNKDDEDAEGEIDVTWTTVGFGLLFSATYD